MQIISVKTPIFQEKNNLVNFIQKQIPSLQEGDIIAITSKIVALSQGRICQLKNKKELIKKNSKKIIKTPWALLTLTNNEWHINAGIDESNAKDKIILLPKNPFKVAKLIQKKLIKKFRLKFLGILITDTKSLPLRVGTIGRAIGYAGFKPLKNYIGRKDLFGRKSRYTQSNIADALAASAVLIMGEGNEQIPIVIIRNSPAQLISKKISDKKYKNLSIPPEKDIFTYVYNQTHHAIKKLE